METFLLSRCHCGDEDEAMKTRKCHGFRSCIDYNVPYSRVPDPHSTTPLRNSTAHTSTALSFQRVRNIIDSLEMF